MLSNILASIQLSLYTSIHNTKETWEAVSWQQIENWIVWKWYNVTLVLPIVYQEETMIEKYFELFYPKKQKTFPKTL